MSHHHNKFTKQDIPTWAEIREIASYIPQALILGGILYSTQQLLVDGVDRNIDRWGKLFSSPVEIHAASLPERIGPEYNTMLPYTPDNYLEDKL